MNIQNHLTTIEADFRAVIAREANNRTEWVEIKIDYCRLTASARAAFASDQEFGRWFDERFGDTINSDDRAAYATMGKDLEATREVLEKTTRTSIQHIYRNEFSVRSRHVTKPEPKPKLEPKLIEQPQEPEQPQERLGKYDAISTDYGLPPGSFAARKSETASQQRTVWMSADVETKLEEMATREGKTVQALVTELIAEKALGEEKAILSQPIKASEQKRMEAYLERMGRYIAFYEKEVEDRIRQKVWEMADATFSARLQEAHKIVDAQKGVFQKAAYQKIMRCLHPDSRNSVTEDRLAEAFRLFTSKERVLIRPDDVREVPYHRPSTVSAAAGKVHERMFGKDIVAEVKAKLDAKELEV